MLIKSNGEHEDFLLWWIEFNARSLAKDFNKEFSRTKEENLALVTDANLDTITKKLKKN